MEDFEKKKKYCEEVIANYSSNHPLYAEAYNNLGVLYDKQNDYENALKNYAKAVNVQPGYAIAHQNLGLLFLRHRQFNEALKQFNNVVQLDENAFVAHYHLGNLYLGKDKLEQAEEHYRAALAMNPEHSDTLSNLGVICLKKDQPQLAIDYFTKALAFDIEHQDARNNMAATFMQYDRYENAARHYRELLQQDPSNEEYHYNIGVAYMNLGHLKEAITHFEYVINKLSAGNNRYAASLNNLAAIYWRLEQKDKAKEFLLKALEIDSNNTISQYMLSALTQESDYSFAPEEYVKNLFDNYAVQYDQHLCQELQYQVPRQIKLMLEKYFLEKKLSTGFTFLGTESAPLPLEEYENEAQLNFPASKPLSKKPLSLSLDLGCGTGLSGEPLKQFSQVLWGVDISEKMLANAEKTKFYDKLYCDEILNFMKNTAEKFECICAAEVFEYVGDLEAVFKLAHDHLHPQGIFVFSIEITKEKTYFLQETARFAHNPDYIRLLAQNNSFKIIQQMPIIARMQNNQPLPACLFLLEANS